MLGVGISGVLSTKAAAVSANSRNSSRSGLNGPLPSDGEECLKVSVELGGVLAIKFPARVRALEVCRSHRGVRLIR